MSSMNSMNSMNSTKKKNYRGRSMSVRNIRNMRNSLFILALGLVLGVLSKWADFYAPLLAELTSGITFWILLASVVAVGSRTPFRAGLHTLLLLGGMVLSYYAAAEWMGGVWSKTFLIGWGIAALLSPVPGALAWRAHRRAKWVCMGVLAAQAGASLLLFGKISPLDWGLMAVTAVILFSIKTK